MNEATVRVIKHFVADNKFMLGLSAIALSSLLLIAPFSTGEKRLSREDAIRMFLLCTLLGKLTDTVVGVENPRRIL